MPQWARGELTITCEQCLDMGPNARSRQQSKLLDRDKRMQQSLATIDCHLQGSSGIGMGPGLDVTRGRHTPVCEREVGTRLWYPNVKMQCPALHGVGGGDVWGPMPHLSKMMRLRERMGGVLNQLELRIHVISCKKHFNHFLGYDWVLSGEFISSSRMVHVTSHSNLASIPGKCYSETLGTPSACSWERDWLLMTAPGI